MATHCRGTVCKTLVFFNRIHLIFVRKDKIHVWATLNNYEKPSRRTTGSPCSLLKHFINAIKIKSRANRTGSFRNNSPHNDGTSYCLLILYNIIIMCTCRTYHMPCI